MAPQATQHRSALLLLASLLGVATRREKVEWRRARTARRAAEDAALLEPVQVWQCVQQLKAKLALEDGCRRIGGTPTAAAAAGAVGS